MQKVLVIDNYDSFTYNLVYYIEKLTGERPAVFRNNEISMGEVAEYDKILLSPGPGIPGEAGICLDLLRTFAPEKSILGVCLGHQAIGEVFGGKLVNLDHVFHGIATTVTVIDDKNVLFRDLPHSFIAGRYHSWVVEKNGLPRCLRVTCTDANQMVMAMSHTEYDVHGVQFHPESVLTEHGTEIIRNWIEN